MLGSRIFDAPHPPGGLHEQRLQMGMRAADDATATLLFAGAVFLRHESEITGDLAGAFEATHHVEGCDEGTGRDRPDARQRREALDHWITRDEAFKLLVSGGEL